MSFFTPSDNARIAYLMSQPAPPIPAQSPLRPRPLNLTKTRPVPASPTSTIAFTDLGAGPGPTVEQKLPSHETTIILPEKAVSLSQELDAYLSKQPTMTQSPESAATVLGDTPLYELPVPHQLHENPFANPYTPHSPSPTASPHHSRSATPHTRNTSSIYSSTPSDTPLHVPPTPTHQHKPSRTSFKRHARKFSAKTAGKVKGWMRARRRDDRPVEDIPPVPRLDSSQYRKIPNEMESHGKGRYKRWRHSRGATLLPSPTASVSEPALPVVVNGVLHRPGRFVEPEEWERREWEDTLGRLEGRVVGGHPLLVREGFGEFVGGLRVVMGEGIVGREMVEDEDEDEEEIEDPFGDGAEMVDEEVEDPFGDETEVVDPFGDGAEVVEWEDEHDTSGEEMGMRGSAWLSRCNTFLDPGQRYQQEPAHAVKRPVHNHKRSLSDSTLIIDARLSNMSTVERAILMGAGRASQLRRRQSMLPNDQSQSYNIVGDDQAGDARIKTWVPLADTVHARREALRVIDDGLRKRTAQEAPSMMAMARGLLSDDADDDCC